GCAEIVPIGSPNTVTVCPLSYLYSQGEVVKMRVKLTLLAVATVVFSLVGLVRAQETQQTSSASGQSAALDTQGIKNYLLGPGDVVEIRIFGQSDLSSTAQVDGEGNLSSLPFLEAPIPAKCRTAKDIQ